MKIIDDVKIMYDTMHSRQKISSQINNVELF